MPICKAGKQFVDLPTSKYSDLAFKSGNQAIALKDATVISQLILQRIPTRKVSLIRTTLERRLDMWNQKLITELMEEATLLQVASKRLSQRQNNGEAVEGQPVYSIDYNFNGRKLSEILEGMHPPSMPISECLVLHKPIPNCAQHHKVVYSAFGEQEIINAVKQKISQVHRCDYADVINDLRTSISVSLARAASTCLHAPQSRNGAPVTSTSSPEERTCHSIDFGLRAEDG
ncbi:hypothetical protein GJ496_007712 [Pomphorhynchus laevis]|nr:hypothetical protein GJ496_007712 [Pomphorhynchus laevis]